MIPEDTPAGTPAQHKVWGRHLDDSRWPQERPRCCFAAVTRTQLEPYWGMLSPAEDLGCADDSS